MPQLTGIVKDGKGKPVSGVRVYVAAGPGSWPDIAAVTNADGRFVLAVPQDGAYEIECATERGRRVRVKIQTPASAIDVRI